MDRDLASADTRRRRIARLAKIGAPVAGIGAVLVFLPGWMRPTLARDRVRTSVVTSGPIESVITASGIVVPEIERVLASPLDARVLRILRRPGAAVKQGEP